MEAVEASMEVVESSLEEVETFVEAVEALILTSFHYKTNNAEGHTSAGIDLQYPIFYVVSLELFGLL